VPSSTVPAMAKAIEFALMLLIFVAIACMLAVPQ
jgi:hypothetical protein